MARSSSAARSATKRASSWMRHCARRDRMCAPRSRSWCAPTRRCARRATRAASPPRPSTSRRWPITKARRTISMSSMRSGARAMPPTPRPSRRMPRARRGSICSPPPAASPSPPGALGRLPRVRRGARPVPAKSRVRSFPARFSAHRCANEGRMRALTYQAPYKVKVSKKRDPEIEHPNDVILRVTRAAICGSDLHLLHGLVPDTRVGSTFGHEFTGVVEELGSSVRTLEKADRVVVPFNISCGTCFYCTRGLSANCENTNPNSDIVGGAFGYSHMTGGYEGGQAEYVRVPFADVGPMKIPDDMDDEEVLFLSDILPTGYQAAEMGEIKGGEGVVIFGAGPVGLFTAKSAWLLGAGRVVVVDHVEYRLDFARRYAGVETVNFKKVDDVVMYLKEICGVRGPEVCVDAVGMEAEGSAP